MHSTLLRQIKKYLGEGFIISPEWKEFFESVSRNYFDFDDNQELLNRSLELSSKEFLEKNQNLKSAKEEIENKIKENTEELEKYQTLVNNLSVGVYRNTTGPQGHFLEANPTIVSMFEADSKEEFMKHNVSDLYENPENRALFIEKLMKYGIIKNEELKLVTLKGKKIIGSVSAVVKKQGDGTVYIDGIIEDITARKKAEDDLKKSKDDLGIKVLERTKDLNDRVLELENVKKAMSNLLADLEIEKNKSEDFARDLEKYKLALDNASDNIIITDSEGIVIYANKAIEKTTGYKPEEAIGKKSGVLWKAPMPQAYYQNMWNTIKNQKKVFTSEIQNKRKNGVIYTATISISPILNKDGGIEFFVGIEHDITKEKEIDKAKTEFVSIASHALRTPLTAIDGIVSMILDGEYGEIDANLRAPLRDVSTSSDRLIHLVNDLLNLSRLQSGKMKYVISDFSIDSVVTEVIHLLKPMAEIKGVYLYAKIDPIVVRGDADKIKEVLTNLIGNSIKFTDKGSITITTKVEDKLKVYVADTGIGISKEDQEKLFGQFQQLQAAQGRPLGTGLGLHISRELLSKMGGEIWVEKSETGMGSTFAFSIPLTKSQLVVKAKEDIEIGVNEHTDQNQV